MLIYPLMIVTSLTPSRRTLAIVLLGVAVTSRDRWARRIARVLVLGGLVTLGASAAAAAPITLPSGLNPGDPYHLIFVTSTLIDASSSNIADYDAFVTTLVALQPGGYLAALGTTWRAVVSTPTVNAIDHIGVTAPVYRLDGLLVATSATDLFDGSLVNPVMLGMGGTNDGGLKSVWTGSTAAGIGAAGNQMGAALVMRGLDDQVDDDWLAFGATTAGTNERYLYAISDELLAPVPEPATVSLLLGPAIALVAWRRRQRSRAAKRKPE